MSLVRHAACSKEIPWVRSTSVVALHPWSKKFSSSIHVTISGTWTTGESSVQGTIWSQFGICCWRKAQSWGCSSILQNVSGHPACALSHRVQGNQETQIELVPTNEIQMLGVPLGSDEKAAAYIEKKLIGRLKSMVDRLADFDDIQSAFFLLRTSFSIVRATHFMRTTPLKKWKQEAVKFDKQIWDAAQSILGLQVPEQTWKQVCLTPRLGGLGLRRVVLKLRSQRAGMKPKQPAERTGQPEMTLNGPFHKKRDHTKKTKTF